jgi:GNAT superfamily N-acetyltransferase
MSVEYRPAAAADVSALASIRAQEWESEEYWQRRIDGYLSGELSPRYSLAARALIVAADHGEIVGFVAGHRTTRFACRGELEWIDVAKERRRQGIASRLLDLIGEWFVEQQAFPVCIDVNPKNLAARKLYAKHGARPLNQHWMIWEKIERSPSP